MIQTYKCKQCGKVTQTEKLMIVHLTWKHRIQLPIGLCECFFDGGLEQIKETFERLSRIEKMKELNERFDKFVN